MSWRDLAGRTVAVSAGTTNEAVLKRLAPTATPPLAVLTLPSVDAAFDALAAHHADAVASDDILLAGLIAAKHAPLRVVGDYLSFEPYAIMLPRDDPPFLALVRNSIARQAESGLLRSGYQRWFMDKLPTGGSLNLPWVRSSRKSTARSASRIRTRPRGGAAGRSMRRGGVVSALGITQTLAWASTYYLPAIFADPISAELHLSRDWFFGIFSAALLLSGLLGPLAGRTIDRRGGRDVLAATNLVFAAGLGLLSLASGAATLAAAWMVIGIGMGFGLYEAAFATVAGLYGRAARNAITGITLFAGFASTVGWPASAFLIDAFGWRGACLAWAGLHLILGLPINRLLVPQAPPSAPEPETEPSPPSGIPWTMIVLAGVFGATWFVSTSMAAHLPRLLEALGATPGAAIIAASLVGPAQVAARLAEFSFLRRASPMISARLATGLHPVGALLLALLGPVAAVPFVLLHGAGNGMLTIARGTLPLALFGPVGYGMRTGLLAAPARILQGAAPLLFGIVLDRAGPLAALLLSFTLTGCSFLALLRLRPMP